MPSDSNYILAELDFEEPSQELLDYAKKELNEDPETSCQILEELRDLIFERGECEPHRIDDEYLIRFLRTKCFVVKKAHRLLVNYCDFKINNPAFYEGVNFKELSHVGKHDLISVPPYRDQNGRGMILYRMGLWNPEITSVTKIFQASLLILELALLQPKAQILGGVCIFDLTDLTMQQVFYMTPNIVKIVFQIMVTSFPFKIYAVHILNQPWLFELVFNLFKPLLNKKMIERIFVHGDNMESLHEHIDSKCLPKRYGGVHPDYDYKDWITFFENSKKVRWEANSLGYDVDVNVPTD